MRIAFTVFAYSMTCTLLLATPVFSEPVSAAKLEFFEKKVRPIFSKHCAGCHSAETNAKGGLRVDDRNGLLHGGVSGPAVVPRDPDHSLMLQRVMGVGGKKRMPLEAEPLSDDQIETLKTWIAQGAAWPPIAVPASLGQTRADYEKLKKEHWAFQTTRERKTPSVRASTWPRDEIDLFVLAKLQEMKLTPAAAADLATLVRRTRFDLTGLPPTPAEIDEVLRVAETSGRDAALAAWVDRLLASPQYGERWGRHWLDVARYGESTGPSRNIPYPHAWRYRDYVIDSVNADVPFDRFIQEQIAGDLLPARDNAERDRLNTATGFLALGVKDVNQRFKVRFVMDNVDEQIDAVTRSTLALTVTCARCHDHKFDPVPTTDYYALAGIFTSTDNCAGVRNKMGGGGLDYYDPSMLVRLTSVKTTPAMAPDKLGKLKADFELAKKEWDAIRGTPEGLKKAADGFPTQRPYRLKFEKLQAEYNAALDPVAGAELVHAVRDAKTVGDTEVRIRGEAEKLGPKTPRGFLTAFDVPGAAKVNVKQSGRLELAQWITSPKNPLTSRVIVNRVWAHLMGRGLVSTVDNFGVTGDTPTHPDLLDHLALRFIREGWSIKKLIRTIVLTKTYQMRTDTSEDQRVADPANRWLSRHTPRRLDSEEIRDAMLAAAGVLSPKRPAASPAKELKMVEMRDNGPEARTVNDHADRSPYRSVYLPLIRGVTPHAMEAFDPVEQTLVTGARDVTTVPGQALFLLNSPFVLRQSLTLAERLLKDHTDEGARVQAAFWTVLGRLPTAAEVERVRGFAGEYESAFRQRDTTFPEKPRPATPPKPNVPTPQPANPDEIDQTPEALIEITVQPKNAREAAWMAAVQALFASGEFRYIK